MDMTFWMAGSTSLKNKPEQTGILSPHKGSPLNSILFWVTKQNPHQTREGLHQQILRLLWPSSSVSKGHIVLSFFPTKTDSPVLKYPGLFIRLAVGHNMKWNHFESLARGRLHTQSRTKDTLLIRDLQQFPKWKCQQWKTINFFIYARVVDVSEIARVSAANE